MPDKVEIVKQVRLTPKQRITLMQASNAGGMVDRMDLDVSILLQHLGLVEKRPRFSAIELKARTTKRKDKLRECAPLLRSGSTADIKKLRRIVDDLDSETWHDNDTAYFLTPAAKEYLVTGKVTVIAGPSKGKTNAG